MFHLWRDKIRTAALIALLGSAVSFGTQLQARADEAKVEAEPLEVLDYEEVRDDKEAPPPLSKKQYFDSLRYQPGQPSGTVSFGKRQFTLPRGRTAEVGIGIELYEVRDEGDLKSTMRAIRKAFRDTYRSNPKTKFVAIAVHPQKGQRQVSPEYYQFGAATKAAKELNYGVPKLALDQDMIQAYLKDPEHYKLDPTTQDVLELANELRSRGADIPLYLFPNSRHDLRDLRIPKWQYNTRLALIRGTLNGGASFLVLALLKKTIRLPEVPIHQLTDVIQGAGVMAEAIAPTLGAAFLAGGLTYGLQMGNQKITALQRNHPLLDRIAGPVKTPYGVFMREVSALLKQTLISSFFLLTLRTYLTEVGLSPGELFDQAFFINGILLGALRTVGQKGLLINHLHRIVHNESRLKPHRAKHYDSFNNRYTVLISAIVMASDLLYQVEWEHSDLMTYTIGGTGALLFFGDSLLRRLPNRDYLHKPIKYSYRKYLETTEVLANVAWHLSSQTWTEMRRHRDLLRGKLCELSLH